jgi:hypothetical protein
VAFQGVFELTNRVSRGTVCVSGPLITDTPALTFQKSFHSGLRESGPRELAPSHEGPSSLGELTATDGTAQPFDVLVLARLRSMRNVVFPRAIELRTLWIRTRELGISLRSWRPRYHGSPPVARYGPKYTDVTPVLPRYYSPGLPVSHKHLIFLSHTLISPASIIADWEWSDHTLCG